MTFAITCFLRFCLCFFYLACFFCFVLFLCCRVRGLERLEKKKDRGRDWGETHTSLALGHSRSKTPRSFCQVVSRGKTSDSRDKIGAKYENCLSSHMYLLELVEWIAGNIQQQDIPARSPAVRAKYVNSKNVALEILRMFVLNFYEPLLDTSMKSNVRYQFTLPAASSLLFPRP